MLTTVRWLTVALGLGLAWTAYSADPVRQDPRKLAQADIEKLASDLTARDLVEKAKKIVAEHDSCDISSVFVMARGKGYGIGKLTELGFPDGVERLVIQLGQKKDLTEANLEKYKDDFLRVAKIMQGMAELAPHRMTEYQLKDEKRKADWLQVSADFKARTAAFRQSIEETDPKKVRLSVLALRQTCNDCHNLRD